VYGRTVGSKQTYFVGPDSRELLENNTPGRSVAVAHGCSGILGGKDSLLAHYIGGNRYMQTLHTFSKGRFSMRSSMAWGREERGLTQRCARCVDRVL